MVALKDGRALSMGGYDANGTPLQSCEIYDPATEKWSETTPMSIARARETATVLPNGKVVVIGGEYAGDSYSGTPTNSVEIFDPPTETWSSAGTIIDARQNHTATLLEDGTILLTGGYSGYGFLNSCEIYDPVSQTSHLVAPLIEERYDHQAILLSTGEALVAGGRIGGTDGIFLNECEIYNPVNNTWRQVDSMSQPRQSGFILTQFSDNTILAAGGRNTSTSAGPGSETLDLSTGQWSQTTTPMKQQSVW
ncbi:MAG TPA: kelch repeat-containing protein, partial [Candidatus Kapabacteria bacterium]|nr:kelch repeat-containing protein [Candidatus Kapabacteria bacterium]